MMREWWSSFRRNSGAAQALAWIVALPIVLALLIAARARGAPGRLGALGVLLVGGLLWIGLWTAPDAEDAAQTERPVPEAPVGASSEPDVDQSPSPTPTRSPTPSPSSVVPAGVPLGVQPAVVERVVDGDTIWVRVDDAIEGATMPANAVSKVRLLEVDAPESASTAECGGNRATGFVRRLAPVGTDVYLEDDVENTDRYDRFLRYVWLGDGRMLNRLLVRRGWAEAVLYEPNDLHWRRMRAAERQARRNDRGIWGQVCAPEPEPAPGPQPASPPKPQPPPARQPAPAPQPQPAPPRSSSCNPNYEPCVPNAPDVDCAGGSGDGPAYVEGPVTVVGDDEYGLDADDDGVGCESG